MRILMYGWEFPPHNTGGLGVACEGIVDGMMAHKLDVHLVLPQTAEPHSITKGRSTLNLTDVSRETIHLTKKERQFIQAIRPYDSSVQYEKRLHESQTKHTKKGMPLEHVNLVDAVEAYGHYAGELSREIPHDVIHAHDWLTYPAAIKAKRISGKPFVAHIHATEFDRSGDNPHDLIYKIEKMGFEQADKIIAVSDFTKQKIVEHYGINPNKIVVIHNAITKKYTQTQQKAFDQDRKKVLFLGRMTMQKGPDYFLRAAQKVCKKEPETLFIMAGDGDMMGHSIHLAIELGIEKNVLFTGFLRGKAIDQAFQNADLFVMPSTSEPFGLVALESIHNGTPVLISKQSGVREVIPNALHVDFWDINEMANKIVAALRYKPMMEDLRHHAQRDLEKIHWHHQAKQMKELFEQLAE